MKELSFHDLPFVRHDLSAPSESGYRRIWAGEKVFYWSMSQRR